MSSKPSEGRPGQSDPDWSTLTVDDHFVEYWVSRLIREAEEPSPEVNRTVSVSLDTWYALKAFVDGPVQENDDER
jgi:hypothetical protein